MPDTIENRLMRLEEKLNKILENFKTFDDVAHNQKVMYDEFKTFKKEFNTFQTKLEKPKEKIKEMSVKIGFLEAENLSLRNDLKEIRSSTENFITESKANEMEVSGIKPLPGENIKQIIMKIGKTVCENIDDSDLLYVE